MKQELVSVIIPVYNVEGFIEHCLDSITNQTYRELEIILVDDGSTDKSGVLCDCWAKKDARVIVIHKRNEGVSSARNEGVMIAKGKYIQFIDPDDWVDLRLIETLYNNLVEYQSDISICGILVTDGENSKKLPWFNNSQVFKTKEAMQLLIQNQKITSHLWNKLYKKEIICLFSFPKGKLYEDIRVMHFIFAECKKISISNKFLYYYYHRSDSITLIPKLENKLQYIDALEERYRDIVEICPKYKDIVLSQIALTISLVIVQNHFSKIDIIKWKPQIDEKIKFIKQKNINKVVKKYVKPKQYIYYKMAYFFPYKANYIYRYTYKLLKRITS